MKLAALIVTLTGFSTFSTAQNTSPDLKSGSYLYHGQPYLEDNSMLIDEAFNQEAGIIQHVSTVVITDGVVNYSYTQEIPLASHKHQLSFTLLYAWLKTYNAYPTGNPAPTNGFGDILLSYHPLVAGKHHRVLVVPRLTLIIPTGNPVSGLGNGGWGSQVNLAVTKRLGKNITVHTNTGYTFVIHADCQRFEGNGVPPYQYEKNIGSVNLGASVVWLAWKKTHLLAEYTFSSGRRIDAAGGLSNDQLVTLNPGIRHAFDIGKVQIVPGVGLPINFTNGLFESAGTFLYLSVEPCYAIKQ